MHSAESRPLSTRRKRGMCARLLLFMVLITGVASAAALLTAKRLSPVADTGGTGVPPPAADRKLP